MHGSKGLLSYHLCGYKCSLTACFKLSANPNLKLLIYLGIEMLTGNRNLIKKQNQEDNEKHIFCYIAYYISI